MRTYNLTAPGKNQVAVLFCKCFQLRNKKNNVSRSAVCLASLSTFLHKLQMRKT